MSQSVERAAQFVGLKAAQELDNLGLLRHYEYLAPVPTHWRVNARIDPNVTYRWPPHSLKKEFSQLIRPWVSPRMYSIPRPYVSSVEILVTRESKAKRLERDATKAGLIVTVTPCIVVPVRNMG